MHPAEAEDGSLYRTLRWVLLPEPSPVRLLAPASRACFPPGCWGFSPAAQTFPVPGQPTLFLGTFWIRIPVIPGTVNAALNTNLLVLFARTFFFSIHIVSVSGLGPVPILLSMTVIIIFKFRSVFFVSCICKAGDSILQLDFESGLEDAFSDFCASPLSVPHQ